MKCLSEVLFLPPLLIHELHQKKKLRLYMFTFFVYFCYRSVLPCKAVLPTEIQGK